MERRFVFKLGKIVTTRQGKFVINLAQKLKKELNPLCEGIEIAGSIRRNKPNPVDIDIVLIPKDKEKIINYLRTRGKFIQGGDKRVTFRIEGVKTELYFTTPESWGATLLAYSSKKGSAIGLRILARAKGFKLNQYGLFRKGRLVAGRTEQEIYHALGRPWKSPEKR